MSSCITNKDIFSKATLRLWNAFDRVFHWKCLSADAIVCEWGLCNLQLERRTRDLVLMMWFDLYNEEGLICPDHLTPASAAALPFLLWKEHCCFCRCPLAVTPLVPRLFASRVSILFRQVSQVSVGFDGTTKISISNLGLLLIEDGERVAIPCFTELDKKTGPSLPRFFSRNVLDVSSTATLCNDNEGRKGGNGFLKINLLVYIIVSYWSGSPGPANSKVKLSLVIGSLSPRPPTAPARAAATAVNNPSGRWRNQQ